MSRPRRTPGIRRKWNASFSPVQMGKQHLYTLLAARGLVDTPAGRLADESLARAVRDSQKTRSKAQAGVCLPCGGCVGSSCQCERGCPADVSTPVVCGARAPASAAIASFGASQGRHPLPLWRARARLDVKRGHPGAASPLWPLYQSAAMIGPEGNGESTCLSHQPALDRRRTALCSASG